MRKLESPMIFTLLLAALVVCGFLFHRSTSLDQERLMVPIYEHLRSTNIITMVGPNDQVIEVVDGGFYYPSAAVFVAENPSCCEFMVKDKQNMSISSWARITGKVVSFIKVSYRPTDQAGNPINGAKQQVRWLEVSHDGKIDDRRLW